MRRTDNTVTNNCPIIPESTETETTNATCPGLPPHAPRPTQCFPRQAAATASNYRPVVAGHHRQASRVRHRGLKASRPD